MRISKKRLPELVHDDVVFHAQFFDHLFLYATFRTSYDVPQSCVHWVQPVHTPREVGTVNKTQNQSKKVPISWVFLLSTAIIFVVYLKA